MRAHSVPLILRGKIIRCSVAAISVFNKPCPLSYSGLLCKSVPVILKALKRFRTRHMLAVFHIPILTFNSPHQQILSFFTRKKIHKFNGFYRMLIFYGYSDRIPAQGASGAESSLIRVHTVCHNLEHIKLLIRILSVILLKKPVSVAGKPYRGGNTSASCFLSKDLLLIYRPFLIKKPIPVQTVHIFYHLQVIRIPDIKIQLSILFIIILHSIHRFKST